MIVPNSYSLFFLDFLFGSLAIVFVINNNNILLW